MATTMTVPVDDPRPVPAAGGPRAITVRANLMPDEVLQARQIVAVRRRVLFALVTLVAFIALGYGASWLQTNSTSGDLADLQRRNDALQSQQSEFTTLVRAQSEVQRVQGQLATLMHSDLPWSSMLGALRAHAPRGVVVITVGGTMTQSTGATPTAPVANPLTTSALQLVGTLTVTGTAPSKAAVAAFADRLGTVKGLTAVMITSITTAASGSDATFNLTAGITTAALGGRFTPAGTAPAATTGGK